MSYWDFDEFIIPKIIKWIYIVIHIICGLALIISVFGGPLWFITAFIVPFVILGARMSLETSIVFFKIYEALTKKK